MLVTTLRIDNTVFHLEPDEDLVGLKRIVETASGTAAFVIFRPVGRGTVSMLVTAHTPVRFEEHERADEETEIGELNPCWPWPDYADFELLPFG